MKGLAIINPSSGKQVLQRSALDAINMILATGVAEEVHLFYTQKKRGCHPESRRYQTG